MSRALWGAVFSARLGWGIAVVVRTGWSRGRCVMEDFKIYLVLCLQGFAVFW